MIVYNYLADAVVVIHAAYIGFVILGLLAILLGVLFHWNWVRNFWFRTGGSIVRNPMRPLLQDLDSSPWPDYSGQDHFIRDEDDRLKSMTDDLLLKFHNKAPLGFQHYPVTSARGCAYHCAYCYNAVFKEMFKGQRRLRFRSLPDVVEEIRTTLDRFPFLRDG